MLDVLGATAIGVMIGQAKMADAEQRSSGLLAAEAEERVVLCCPLPNTTCEFSADTCNVSICNWTGYEAQATGTEGGGSAALGAWSQVHTIV